MLPGKRARVKIPKNASCDTCDHSEFCDPFGNEYMVLEASNHLGARPGQVVQVVFSRQKPLKALALLYLMPLAALLTGAAIGHWIAFFGNQNASSAILSLVLVAVSFFALRIYSNRQYRKDPQSQPRISKIVD